MPERAQDRLAVDAARLVDLAFRSIYLILGFGLLLAIFGVSSERGLPHLVQLATGLLHAPFSAMLPDLMDGAIALAVPVLLTLLLSGVLHGLTKALLRKLGPAAGYL